MVGPPPTPSFRKVLSAPFLLAGERRLLLPFWVIASLFKVLDMPGFSQFMALRTLYERFKVALPVPPLTSVLVHPTLMCPILLISTMYVLED